MDVDALPAWEASMSEFCFMSADPYPVIEIHPEWVLEPEAMGSKTKFWYRPDDESPNWLFKFSQANTGQHWAEKAAAEIAAEMGVAHARVELATFDNTYGSATESFARGGRELIHGNQVLAGKLSSYDPKATFHHSDHTLGNICLALDRMFPNPEGAARAKASMAEYLVLDAVIGNTDRHHENWGLLRKRVGDRWTGFIAPSFDHASSLGREMLDDGAGRSRRRLLEEGNVGRYVEKAHGGIFWQPSDKRGLSPLELVRRAVVDHRDIFLPALERVKKLDMPKLAALLDRIPERCMSATSREFALALLGYSIGELNKLRL